MEIQRYRWPRERIERKSEIRFGVE
jgi:hypothetical protein